MKTRAALLLALPLPAWALPDVVVVHNDQYVSEVQTNLVNSGQFDSVTLFNAGTSAPSAAYLSQFDAALVYLNGSYNDPFSTGEAVVDYLALGGGVVIAYPPFMGGNYSLPGRLGALLPMYQLSGSMNSSLMVVTDPSSPIVSGVSYLDTGSMHGGAIALPGAHLVASTEAGYGLVAEWAIGGGTLVGVNMFPASSAVVGSITWTGDGAALLANALTFAAAGMGTPPEAEVEVHISGSCPGTVQVDVTGATPFGDVGFVVGGGDSYMPIPRGSCYSVGLPLTWGLLKGVRAADGSGNLSFTVSAPYVCGYGVVAVDKSTCRVSYQALLP